MSVTCRGKDLEVLKIKGEVVEVKAEGWACSYDIPRKHLRKTRGK